MMKENEIRGPHLHEEQRANQVVRTEHIYMHPI